MSFAAPVPVACLSLDAMVGYFRSIAFGVEMRANTHLNWKNYDDSTVLNVIYTLMPWKGHPGWAEVSTDWARLGNLTNQRAGRYLNTFLDKLVLDGPQAALVYADAMNAMSVDARRDVANLIAEAHSINDAVMQATNQGIRKLALIKFGCTVTLAATGCWLALGAAVPVALAGGASASSMAASAGLINAGYAIAGGFVKEGGLAGAKAFAIEATKKGIEKSGELLKETVETRMARRIGLNSDLIRTAQDKVDWMNQRLAGKLKEAKRDQYLRRVGRATGAIADANKNIAAAERSATLAKAAGTKAIPLVFLAMDVIEASGDLKETWKETR